MNRRRSWLCPTDLDRTRVVEASERVRRSRILIWAVIGFCIAAVAPWNGWWVLLLFVPAGINLALLETMLRRSGHPERWAFGTTAFLMALFAAAVPLTGGATSAAVPLVIIPAAVAPMRFRGAVVAAFGGLTAAALLVVTLGLDTAATLDDPRLVITTLALLVCVTLANWSLVEAEMKQRDAAILDPLTGLLNRQTLESRVQELGLQARLTGGSVALIACDLDRFKQVNDTHGHDRGDAVLKAVAYEMRKCMRSFELIYRLGGEEFLIVLPNVDLQGGIAAAERLRRTIEATRPGGIDSTVSFGVSAAAGPEVDFERLSKAADEALYEAKATGRNRVVPEPSPAPVPTAEQAMASVS